MRRWWWECDDSHGWNSSNVTHMVAKCSISLSEGTPVILSSWVWACGSNELHRIVPPSLRCRGCNGGDGVRRSGRSWETRGQDPRRFNVHRCIRNKTLGSDGWAWLRIDTDGDGGDEWLTLSLFYLCAETDRVRRLYRPWLVLTVVSTDRGP